jgi:hypothetical protein
MGMSRDDYPVDDFRRQLPAWIEQSGLGLRAIEKLSGVMRRTIRQVVRGERPCSRPARIVLMALCGVPEAVQAQYLPKSRIPSLEPDPFLLDLSPSYHLPLQFGLNLHIHGMYAQAQQEFLRVVQAAGSDLVLMADAAGRLAWLFSEKDDFKHALHWVNTSIDWIETHVASPLDEIICSLHPGAHLPLISRSDTASQILDRALHLKSKILLNGILYARSQQYRIERSTDLEAATDRAFAQSRVFTEYLQNPKNLGDVLRWEAVREAVKFVPDLDAAKKLLEGSRETCVPGGLGDAYVTRNSGIAYWQADQPKRAREMLRNAVAQLSSFANPRALALTLHSLSNFILEREVVDQDRARRYVLAAAALHPYGIILSDCRQQVEFGGRRNAQRDIEDLLAEKEPFHSVGPVMKRLAQGRPNNPPLSPGPPRRPGPPRTADQLIQQNLSCVSGEVGTVMDEICGRKPNTDLEQGQRLM